MGGTRRIKQLVACVVFLTAFFIVFTACGDNKAAPEAPGIKWIDPGAGFISVRFDEAGENLYMIEAAASDGSVKCGFIDGSGEVKIPVIYDKAREFSDGVCYVELNKKKMYIDPSGNVVLDVSQYDSATSFNFGYAAVTAETSFTTDTGYTVLYRQGIIDKSGKEIIPCEYAQAGCFENGVIWAITDANKYEIFDGSGNGLTGTEYDYIEYAGVPDLLIATKDGKYGYIDRTGRVVIPFEYDEAYGFFDGFAVVGTDGHRGYINTKGEKLTTVEFDWAYDFSDGLAIVEKDGKYGYIDTHGNLAVPFEYDKAYNFEGGVATVAKGSDSDGYAWFGTIDKNGKTAITPKEQGCYKWDDSYVVYYDPDAGSVEIDLDHMALLDKSGKNRLTEFSYSDIGDFTDGVAVAEQFTDDLSQYGIINQNGAEVVPLIFDKIAIADGGKCVVQSPDADSGDNSRVGILTLPKDASTRKP